MTATRRSVALAGHTGDVDGARQGLGSTDAAVRAAALGALERLGALSDAEVAAALTDDSATVRRRAATVAAVHPLVELLAALSDRESAVIEVAAWACGEREVVNDPILARLVELATLVTADPLVRESSVAGLAAIVDNCGISRSKAATSSSSTVLAMSISAPTATGRYPSAHDVGNVIA